MTVNTIAASVLKASQMALNATRDNTDALATGNTDWPAKANEILATIPVNKDVDLLGYLKASKGYDDSDLAVVGTLISAIASPKLSEALASNADLAEFTGDGKPDNDIVNHILKGLKLDVASTTAAAAAASPVTTASEAEQIVLAAGMEHAINQLVSGATGGKVPDLNAFFGQHKATQDELVRTKGELTQALFKASRPVVPTTGTVKVDAGELTYELIEVPANSIFKSADGKPTGKGFSFPIPTLVWKDAAGNVVSHPETPELDDNYDFSAVRLLQFLTAFTNNMNAWLFGHTGTGKTTFVEQVAARIGFPCIRINLDANLERADIVGHVALHEEKGTTVTKFEEGILPYAMQRPGFLIMDEIDAGRPDILFSVQKALESKGLTLTEDNHRIIKPHPLFRFAATANTRGQGDEYGMYQGVRAMNASLIDRFTCFIQFDYMSADREAELLRKLVPSLSKDLSDRLAQLASEIRKAFNKGEVYNTVSPRGLTVMATSFASFIGIGVPADRALQMSMEMSLLNKVSNDTRQKFIELGSRCLGTKVK